MADGENIYESSAYLSNQPNVPNKMAMGSFLHNDTKIDRNFGNLR